MKLAEQVGATIRPGEDGMVDVVVGGMALVSKGTASALALAGATGAGRRRHRPAAADHGVGWLHRPRREAPRRASSPL